MMYIEIYNIRNEYNITGWDNFYQPNANHTPSDPILRSHFALKVAKHFKKQHELTDVPFLAILVFSHPHEQQDYRTRGELHIMQTLQYPGNLKAICATPAASGFAIL